MGTNHVEAAKARQRQATSTGGSCPRLGANLPQAEVGKASDRAANQFGVSRHTAQKAATVVESIDELKTVGDTKAASGLGRAMEESVSAAYRRVAPVPVGGTLAFPGN